MEILFGVIAGVVTGLGMGGGTILILLLSLFSGLEQHVAQATNLIFFVPTAIAAIWMNLKQNNIDKQVAKVVSLFGMVGAMLGAVISKNLEGQALRKWFAIFIFFIALYEVYGIYREYGRGKNPSYKIKKK